MSVATIISWRSLPDGTIEESTDGGATWSRRVLSGEQAKLADTIRKKWSPVVDPIAAQKGLPSSLVFAVIHQESLGNERARNPHDGGCGLMQVTGGNQKGLTDEQLFEPHQNVLMGCAILRAAWTDAHGDIPAACSIYNAGEPFLLPDGTACPGTPANVKRGAKRSYRPWTNADWELNQRKPMFLSRWGYAVYPGYIDFVVAASNYHIMRTRQTPPDGSPSPDGDDYMNKPPTGYSSVIKPAPYGPNMPALVSVALPRSPASVKGETALMLAGAIFLGWRWYQMSSAESAAERKVERALDLPRGGFELAQAATAAP